MFKAVKIVFWKYLIIKIITVKKYKFLTTKKKEPNENARAAESNNK